MRTCGPRLAALFAAAVLAAAVPAFAQSAGPLWFGWADEGRLVVPLGRWYDGAWSNPFPTRWTQRDPHDPCPEKHRTVPPEWWGQGGAPSLEWTGWGEDGNAFPVPLSGWTSTACDFGTTRWVLGTARPVDAPGGRGGFFVASQALDLVPSIELAEGSVEVALLREPLLREIVRLELLGRGGGGRREGRDDCLPKPPLTSNPDLAIRVIRSLVPVGGAFVERVEVWSRGNDSPDQIEAIGPEESFVAWVVECDGRVEIVSRRFRFALRNCSPDGDSGFFAYHPTGFFELAGRRYALLRLSGEASEVWELVEIRTDGVRTILVQGRGWD